MPNFDRTGPNGQGPLTGRRRGRCVDTNPAQTVKPETKPEETKEIILGVGRGGRPSGGGRGNCYGGGNRKGQGRKQSGN